MNSLVGVLIQFREERVAIVSNIEAMFHQDRVDLMHHDALRFVWWHVSKPDRFSLCWCMYSALRPRRAAQVCLIQAAEGKANDYEVTVETVKSNFSVDCIKLSG